MTTYKKRMLLPNEKAGVDINWEERLANPEEWMISEKLDGARVELLDGQALSREMKLIKSSHVQRMADNLYSTIQIPGEVEAEFWAPNMTFPELMHFFKTEDVTSPKTIDKYNKLWAKTGGDPAKGWKYPGRSVQWLTTWHPELNFYVFDHIMHDDTRSKELRYLNFKAGMQYMTSDIKLIQQFVPTHIDQVYQAYDQSIMNGGEGLVAIKADSLYKHGRLTLKECQGFKIKDSNVEFHGSIMGIVEGTVAKEGTTKTVNAFGRSKTSQLKEDREPSGMASGFHVRMDDGRELTVSLKGFDHPDRQELLHNQLPWIGKRIMFTGSNPVKEGGVPRHAHYDGS